MRQPLEPLIEKGPGNALPYCLCLRKRQSGKWRKAPRQPKLLFFSGVLILLNFAFKSGVAVAICAALALPAVAADRTVEIVNKTGYAITEFYGSNNGTTDWQEDILGADVLPHNSSVSINFD